MDFIDFCVSRVAVFLLLAPNAKLTDAVSSSPNSSVYNTDSVEQNYAGWYPALSSCYKFQ